MLLHLLTAACGTGPPCRDVRIDGGSWSISGPPCTLLSSVKNASASVDLKSLPPLRKSYILVRRLSNSIPKGLIVVANDKSGSPTWIDVKAALLSFDRAGHLGLVQDLYAGSKDNQAFLHARLSLGRDQLKPYKAMISDWICPDLMRNQQVSVSKAKKAIAEYKKAIGQSEGLAELSIFYCEEAFSFLESCGMEDESYFHALIRMYNRALRFVSNLPPDARIGYVDRLDKLRSRARHVGWGVEDELNSLWHATELDEYQRE